MADRNSPSDLSGVAPGGRDPAPVPSAPTPAAPIAVAGDGDLAEGMRRIEDQIAALRQDFATKIQYDQTKDGQIDRLHQELEAYKRGLQFSLLRPILSDLIGMYDDLGQFVDHHQATLTENVGKSLRSFQQGILETLQRNGVEAYRESGDTFNSERQRVNQPVDTPNQADDRRICRRLRPGFAYEGRILRQEVVDVYRFAAR